MADEAVWTFLQQPIGFWIQTGAFVASALAALWLIRSNHGLERRRATIDLILRQKADQRLLRDTRKLWDLSDESSASIAALVADTSQEDCRQVLRVLSSHEFVALGIRKKAFDERIYQMSQHSNVMKVWSSAQGFIYDLRNKEQKQTLFQEFEWLARRWEKKPIKRLEADKKWFCHRD